MKYSHEDVRGREHREPLLRRLRSLLPAPVLEAAVVALVLIEGARFALALLFEFAGWLRAALAWVS